MSGFFSDSQVQKEKPVGLSAKCGACGLYKTCRSPKMPVYGDGRLRVLVVGEAPGQTEDESNRPFVGKAGQFLRQSLKQIGVSLDQDAWSTNALICRPPGNKTPDQKQIGYCLPNLQKTIAFLEPRVIVTLGRVPLEAVLRSSWNSVGALERWVGWTIPMGGYWVCPAYHPSFLLRSDNGLLNKLFVENLQAAFEIDRDPPSLPDFRQRIECLYDDSEICGAVTAIAKAGGLVAFDYETNCLKPEYHGARIVSCAVSNGRKTVAYPWTEASKNITGCLLFGNRTQKIAANLKFEERWTRHEFGRGVNGWAWDTMLAAHCLDNRPGICGLKFQSFVRMGVPVYNENVEPYLESSGDSHLNRIQDIDTRTLLFYNGMDALLEHRLARIQRKDFHYGND